jgi:hypothetical protein
VNHARVSRRSGERENDERSRLACGAASPRPQAFARFGVNHARVSRRSGERENDERSRRNLSARNLLRNLLAFVGAPRSESSGAEMRCLSARFGVNHAERETKAERSEA